MAPIVQHLANHARLTASTRFSGSSRNSGTCFERRGFQDTLVFIPIEDSSVRFLVALEIGRFDPRA